METLRCFGVFNSPSSTPFLHRSQHNLSSINNLPSTAKRANCSCLPAFLAAAVLFSSPVPPEETLANIPQTLSGEDARQTRIQRPRSKKAESCTAKCVGTCVRGGAGEGILNIRRPLVVFKKGFRSRHYCLVECSDICNLIKDGDDGP
ncbi:uncharacterized protein LOC110092436 isoform X1 [Dendrobium catenatum]|uniref:Uncharacterized protein n=2 Tax=Dendrobium catenatum TaxID=906689 RepID=A0A2I0XIS3_9ASPA|nr:uncharacterized protein LOC110092436 isoform X1 [Dendrobium catenatum]PKU87816.1 hypothetical protein MA16_Dca021162 [Dendrobium catenatum]